MTDAIVDRRQGGLLGLLMGDAAGVPFEFFHPEELAELPKGSFKLPFDVGPPFYRSHTTAPAGAWSDDGSQALALLDSLSICGGLDEEDLGRRLRAWYEKGDYAPDLRVFDVGIQTRRALERLSQGIPATQSGPAEEGENGNGSLMRVLPLALWHTGSDKDLVEAAHRQSVVTHGHKLSQACCALLCLWAKELLSGDEDGFDEALAKLQVIYADDASRQHELRKVLIADCRNAPRGSGYVVDCLWSARQAFLSSPRYDQVVGAAIALGHDTDTTAAVAGGLAGIRTGAQALPAAWLAALTTHPCLTASLDMLANVQASPARRPKVS